MIGRGREGEGGLVAPCVLTQEMGCMTFRVADHLRGSITGHMIGHMIGRMIGCTIGCMLGHVMGRITCHMVFG